MEWRILLQPTRQKVIFSLMPFIFPIVQFFFTFVGDGYYQYLSVDAIIVQSDFVLVVGGIESFISQPFEPLLRSVGWWSRDSIFVGPDGPLLPGSFAVAVVYSSLIYLLWSTIAYWRRMK